MATYTKLRNGDWGVKGPDGIVKPGATVTVTKRSGETKEEKINKIVWEGDGIVIATIAPGSNGSNRAVCAECGKGGRLVPDLEDGMLKHYNCCDIPPG